MRVPFDKADKGSQKWIQIAVNDETASLDRAVRAACGFQDSELIAWLSPLREDGYAEYRDGSFIDRLGVKLPNAPLGDFWPRRGPQWDGLGRAGSEKILLVEAKANISELISPACKASDDSKALITRSLQKVQEFLHVDLDIDWSGKFYQFANRLAHLYFLREINKIPAFLIFVYLIGDKEVNGPSSRAEWMAALEVVKSVLGITKNHRLSKYLAEVYLEVALLSATDSGKVPL